MKQHNDIQYTVSQFSLSRNGGESSLVQKIYKITANIVGSYLYWFQRQK